MSGRTIWCDQPKDWRDLQDRVCTLFREMGCQANAEASVILARGTAVLDVHVRDDARQPGATYVCECKQWSRSVPKSTVHAFRTVVSDLGAQTGFLISQKGFQKGGLEAARHTNVKLVNWKEFQDLFYDRWLAAMMARLRAEAELIFNYMDVLDDRVSAALNKGQDAQDMFNGLFRRFVAYARFNTWTCIVQGNPAFPLECPDPRSSGGELTCFSSPREFFEVMFEWRDKAAKAFEHFLRT